MSGPGPASGDGRERLRRFPHPFRAMLAISSDIDGTTVAKQRAMHRLFNTREETREGEGLGLDFANSVWMYNPAPRSPRSLTYFSRFDPSRVTRRADEIVRYIRCGWIDTLHTYGNFSQADRFGVEPSREHALRALDALAAQDVAISVWTDHGNRRNLHNLSVEGDVPGSSAYHADRLRAHGVRFVWNHGRSRAFGLDNPLRSMLLRDGGQVWGFSRVSAEERPDADVVGEREGVRHGTTPNGDKFFMTWFPNLLPYQLAPDRLDALVAAQQYVILAQHLGVRGKRRSTAGQPRAAALYQPDVIDALRRLRAYVDAGKIIVARTSRLLEYARVWHHVAFRVEELEGRTTISIDRVDDPVLGSATARLEQCRGLTFHVASAEQAVIVIDGRRVPEDELVRTRASAEEGATVGIRWFAADVRDYTVVERDLAASA